MLLPTAQESFASSTVRLGVDKIDPTSTALAVLATTAAAFSGPDSGPINVQENGECKLLGPFSLLIQGALGALALLSLVWKRYRERPQRPMKVWAFDVSKQVVGSILLHLANLLMSMLSAGKFDVSVTDASTVSSGNSRKPHKYQPNPCSFYLLNLAIDTTIGIPILVGLLRVLTYLFSLTPMGRPRESITSGHYGHPPKATWWAKQSFIYFWGLFGMKLCVFFIFQFLPWLGRVGDWALKWTEGNEKVQVFFVMLLFPVIMNALQYYIIDSFIKDQTPSDHEPIPSEDGEEHDHHHRRRRDSAESLASEGSLGDGNSGKSITKFKPSEDKHKGHHKKLSEYDPEADGDESSTVSSGGSSSNDEDAALVARKLKDLKPVE